MHDGSCTHSALSQVYLNASHEEIVHTVSYQMASVKEANMYKHDTAHLGKTVW